MRAQRLDRETRVWHRLKHPNVLEFFGVVHNMGELFALVSPYCAQGSISGYLERYPQANRLRLVTRVPHSPHRALTSGQILEVANAIEYLHKNNVIHGDVKGVS